MGNDECKPVSVSRRIEAPAADIFELLADPDRHHEFDGSAMLRPGASNKVIFGIGDVFVTKRYFAANARKAPGWRGLGRLGSAAHRRDSGARKG